MASAVTLQPLRRCLGLPRLIKANAFFKAKQLSLALKPTPPQPRARQQQRRRERGKKEEQIGPEQGR